MNPTRTEDVRNSQTVKRKLSWFRLIEQEALEAPSNRSPRDQCKWTASIIDCSPLSYTIGGEKKGSASAYITPFIDRRDEIGDFESRRLWSATWEQATRQLLLCYCRKPPPIKAQRAAGRGWTAPRRSKHLWGATLSNHKARQESRKTTCMTTLPLLSGSGFAPRMMHHAHHIQRCYVYFPLHMDASMHLRCGLRPGRLLMLQGSQGSPDADDEIMGTEWTELYWLTRRQIIWIINQNP